MLFDLHNDFPTALSDKMYDLYLSDACGVTITGAVWSGAFDADIEKCVKKTIACLKSLNTTKTIPVAIEDIGFTAERELYKTFDFSDCMYCSLTWNYNNRFAGGALDDGVLTKSGKDVIEIMNAQGCAVDLAHLNERSFYSAVDCAVRAVCSHTGFNRHLRSLDDRRIRLAVSRNIVIGLSVVTAFTDADSAQTFADVIDRFVQKYGVRCLAVGTDFNGSSDIPEEIKSYNGLMRVADILKFRGYDDRSIQDIFYNNAYSFFKKER